MSLRAVWNINTGDSGLKNPCVLGNAVFVAGHTAIHAIDLKKGTLIRQYAFADVAGPRSLLDTVGIFLGGLIQHNGVEFTESAIFVRGQTHQSQHRCWAWGRRSHKPLSKFKEPVQDLLLRQHVTALEERLKSDARKRLQQAVEKLSPYGRLCGTPVQTSDGTFYLALTYTHHHYCCDDGYTLASVPRDGSGWTYTSRTRFSRCTGPLLHGGTLALIHTFEEKHELITISATSGQELRREAASLDGYSPEGSANELLFSVRNGELRADALLARSTKDARD